MNEARRSLFLLSFIFFLVAPLCFLEILSWLEIFAIFPFLAVTFIFILGFLALTENPDLADTSPVH